MLEKRHLARAPATHADVDRDRRDGDAVVAAKKEEMPTEEEESRGRGDNLANRRDDKFTDQREEKREKRGLQRRRAAQREELLALPNTRKPDRCCGGLRHCSRMSDKTKDERRAASPRQFLHS